LRGLRTAIVADDDEADGGGGPGSDVETCVVSGKLRGNDVEILRDFALFKVGEEDLYQDDCLEHRGEDIVVILVCLVADEMWYCRAFLEDRAAAPGRETRESIDLVLARRQRAQM
jgi:hypothetical protein